MDSWLQEAAKEGFEEDIIPQENTNEKQSNTNVPKMGEDIPKDKG